VAGRRLVELGVVERDLEPGTAHGRQAAGGGGVLEQLVDDGRPLLPAGAGGAGLVDLATQVLHLALQGGGRPPLAFDEGGQLVAAGHPALRAGGAGPEGEHGQEPEEHASEDGGGSRRAGHGYPPSMARKTKVRGSRVTPKG